MKLSQFNYEVTKQAIENGLNNYINYCNENIKYAKYYNNMDALNKKYLGHPMDFFTENNIDSKKFFDDKQYFDLLAIASDVINHIDDIHTKIIEVWIDPDLQNKIYPLKVKEWLNVLNNFCYNRDKTFMSLQEQNEKLRIYVHYDASVKRPQCLGSFNSKIA